MKKRTIALLMAVVMLFGVTVGGTIAWLTAQSAKVENTFTFGDVNIKLDEAPVDANGTIITGGTRGNGNSYDLIPGQVADKDPMVTVEAGSEDCFVFVKIIETANTYGGDTAKNIPALSGKVITYTVGSNWKPVSGTDGVYVYGEPTKVSANAELKEIIADNKITVNSALTKSQIEDIKADNTLPKLEFVAYAIQAENLGEADTAAEIWALINP